MDDLELGMVFENGRTLMAFTQIAEKVEGDTHARWVGLCFTRLSYYPYVVWDIISKPEGWVCANGEYANNLKEAQEIYYDRGGERNVYEIAE